MSTSREQDVQNLEEANLSLVPLSSIPELEERELAYFESYAQGKALGDWFEHEIIVLSHLAKLSCIIDGLIENVKNDGTTVVNLNSGQTRANPDITTMRGLISLELSCIKSMRLAVKEGRETPSKRSDMSKRADKQKHARRADVKSGLLASPE